MRGTEQSIEEQFPIIRDRSARVPGQSPSWDRHFRQPGECPQCVSPQEMSTNVTWISARCHWVCEQAEVGNHCGIELAASQL